MKTIIVTGGAGFIGSHFITYMLKNYSDYMILNVDALTYAGNLENLRSIDRHPRYRFVKADIRDRTRIQEIFSEHDVLSVVNFAAESHVDRSIEEPEVFLTTNIIGTQVLLNAAMMKWKLHPQDKHSRAYQEGVKFLQISTDEVYGSLGARGHFVEETPLAPNSPYSASKASADLMVRAYHETYGLPVNITRCSNNYGPCQYPEKLIPLTIQYAREGKTIPIYGDGRQVRDWIYVKDHCVALDKVLHFGRDGEVYNIGGNNERTNLEVVKMILSGLGKSEDLICYVKDRPGHDRRYAIDSSKLEKELGWKAKYGFEEGIQETLRYNQEGGEGHGG